MNLHSIRNCLLSYALLLAWSGQSVLAEESGSGGEVEGTIGWLYIEGVMYEAACRIQMDSRWQNIILPAVSTQSLTKLGDTGEVTPFHIKLEGCLRSAGRVMDQQKNTLAWSSQQPIVTMTFAGVATESNPNLFRVNGATGIGLRLIDSKGQQIRPGIRSEPWFLNPGDNTLQFSVALERTATKLMADSYNATLDFQIHYQ
ncbi:fimbrial protein [Acinetobacter vivianii]|uniref:Fimbrial protein n=1 Tax=Acinetobacter vivianii TaxID=1776742 RepID=A0AAJ6P5V2_9GAMM|nr:fimbrial protein [Acinetobacter vivianii]WDZ51805.1 fimbrial protein [Acinetobacter vivianii]